MTQLRLDDSLAFVARQFVGGKAAHELCDAVTGAHRHAHGAAHVSAACKLTKECSGCLLAAKLEGDRARHAALPRAPLAFSLSADEDAEEAGALLQGRMQAAAELAVQKVLARLEGFMDSVTALREDEAVSAPPRSLRVHPSDDSLFESRAPQERAHSFGLQCEVGPPAPSVPVAHAVDVHAGGAAGVNGQCDFAFDGDIAFETQSMSRTSPGTSRDKRS